MNGSVSEQNAEEKVEQGPQSLAEAMESMPAEQVDKIRLARIAGAHVLFWMVTMGLFAAADSWHILSSLGFAAFFAAITGVLAGVTTTTLVHEWGHYVGARRSGGAYVVPDKLGLFVYDWEFKKNSVDQFMTMSRAGTIGGAIGLLLIWLLVPTDTLGRAALLAGAVAGFAFGGKIEWPVLRRVSGGGDPLTELSTIDQGVLWSAFLTATGFGLVALWLTAP